MGQITAAHIEMAAARLEAQRDLGTKYERLRATPIRRFRSWRLARHDLRAAERYWDEHLDALWLNVIREREDS